MRLLKDRVAKADGLEETTRKQEMVIQRLEAMINTYIKEKRSAGETHNFENRLYETFFYE